MVQITIPCMVLGPGICRHFSRGHSFVSTCRRGWRSTAGVVVLVNAHTHVTAVKKGGFDFTTLFCTAVPRVLYTHCSMIQAKAGRALTCMSLCQHNTCPSKAGNIAQRLPVSGFGKSITARAARLTKCFVFTKKRTAPHCVWHYSTYTR